MFTHTAEGLAKWSSVTQCEDSLQKQYEYETREMHMCGEADSFIKPKKIGKLKDMKAENVSAYGRQICGRFPIIEIQAFLVFERGRMDGGEGVCFILECYSGQCFMYVQRLTDSSIHSDTCFECDAAVARKDQVSKALSFSEMFSIF